MNSTRYPKLMIYMHWLVAILVLIAYVSGGNPVKHEFQGQIHVAAGILIAALFFIRLIIRLISRKHIPQHSLPSWQTKLASIVHILLYLCMVLIPLTGVLALASFTEQFNLFGFAIPLPNFYSAIPIGDIHELLVQAFIGLAGIHALAGLLHHFLWKDNVLKSMSPH